MVKWCRFLNDHLLMHFNGNSMFVASYYGVYLLVFLLCFRFVGIVLSATFRLPSFHLFFSVYIPFFGICTINLIMDDIPDSCLHMHTLHSWHSSIFPASFTCNSLLHLFPYTLCHSLRFFDFLDILPITGKIHLPCFNIKCTTQLFFWYHPNVFIIIVIYPQTIWSFMLYIILFCGIGFTLNPLIRFAEFNNRHHVSTHCCLLIGPQWLCCIKYIPQYTYKKVPLKEMSYYSVHDIPPLNIHKLLLIKQVSLLSNHIS